MNWYLWMVLAAMAGDPATQPAEAAEPTTQPAAVEPARPMRITVGGIPEEAREPQAREVEAEPALIEALRAGLGPEATQPAGLPLEELPARVATIGDLSGGLVEIEVVDDGTLVLKGSEEDLAILEAFIEMLDTHDIIRTTFRIFDLKHAQAQNLAPRVTQFWNELMGHRPAGIRPQDRITIIPEARANLLMVGATEQNMEKVADIIRQLDQPALGESARFIPIELEHINASEAAQVITELLQDLHEQRGAQAMINIRADPRTNTLLVTAPEEDLDQIRHLVRLIDVEPTPETGGVVKLALYPLRKAVVGPLASVLSEMLAAPSEEGRAMREQIRRLQVLAHDRDGDARTIADLNLEKPIRVFSDDNTNSLIVATVESNIAPIGEIIRLLDSVPLADEVLVKIYPLEFADAETVLDGVREVFDQGVRLREEPGRGQPALQARIPPTMPGSALSYPIGLSADRRTNTIVVSGRPEQILLVEQILQAVDIEEDAHKFRPRLVQLQHADVQTIQDVLQRVADRWGEAAARLGDTAAERERVLVIPDIRTNSLIIVAKDDNYNALVDLALELDGADLDFLGQIRIINLENLTAADLSGKVEQLWERRAELRQRGGLPPDRPIIVSDPRSNSMIIASNPEDFEAIERLVRRLEEQPLSPMHEIRQVEFKHTEAAKVSEIIQRLFDERMRINLAEGQTEQPSDRIFVIADATTNTMLITASKSNFDEITELVKKLDVPPPVEGLIRLFPVRHHDVNRAATLIRSLFEEGVYPVEGGLREIPEAERRVTIVTDARSSSLIVSASPQNFAIIERLLEQIDREDTVSTAGFRYFPVEHADVVNVADMLEQMFEGMREAMAQDERDQLELRVIPDIRSSRLIISGTRFAMKKAEELMPGLDVAPGTPTSEVRVYKLSHASASRLQRVLTELFEKRATEEQTGRRTPITIIADEGSNSLIAVASRDDHRLVDHWTDLLDRKSPRSQQMRIFPLEMARAEAIGTILSDLLEAQQTAETEESFAVVPDERTNSLIVYGAPDLLSNVAEIIGNLDTTATPRTLEMRVFRLFNQRADDLAERLETFFTTAGAGDPASPKQLLIQFTHVDPTTGAAILDKLIHQDITITPEPVTNSLLVLAPAAQVDMLQMLIEMLDSVEPLPMEMEVFLLHNADATEMKDLLDNLFQTGQQQDGAPRLIFEGGPGVLMPGGEGQAMSVDIAFAVDTRTNAVIAAGSKNALAIARRLITRLDHEQIEDRVVQVVRLRHAKASDVAGTMQQHFEEENRLLEQAETGASAQLRLQRQVSVRDFQQTEGESNILVVSYSPRMESQVVRLINELDQPPPQVMIQVLMAEVTLDDRFELGMEFAVQDLVFSERAFLGPNDVVKGSGHDIVFGTDLGAAGSGLGGISFTITGADFNFLLRALQVEGRLEVLSRPSILVQDGREALIAVGERVPTVQDVVVSGVGVVTPSVTYEQVGIRLNVTPIINPDGFVNMLLEPEISSIAASSVSIGSGITLPIFTERTAQTEVTVKDGESVIIGGLITSRINESENKVPLAGDIPILGALFRASVRTTTKTELLIILTPHVIRTVEEARSLSVQMRDQTGLIDDIRTSPLMGKLRVDPDEDQFGPLEPLRPLGDDPLLDDGSQEPFGPELEELGPEASMIRVGPDRASIAIRSD